jgi:hypothetical protein
MSAIDATTEHVFFDYHPTPLRCVLYGHNRDGKIRRELHCGECFTLHTVKGFKVPVRIELDGSDWYLVGVTPSNAAAWDGQEVTP